MNGENKENQDEQKELLARGEIRTMQKDIQKLRETQAVTDREKLARIKTEEEVKLEETRKARAQEAALAREAAEKEAQSVEGRLQKLREEQEERQKEAPVIEPTPKPSQLSEEEPSKQPPYQPPRPLQKSFNAPSLTPPSPQPQGQAKPGLFNTEEESRKRFMERIAAKAEGKETPADSGLVKTPISPLTVPSAQPLPTISKPLFKKPSSGQKVWVRIVLGLAALALIGLVSTFWYWYLAVRNKTVAPVETPITTESPLVVPESLISTDGIRTLNVSSTNEISFALFQTAKEEINDGLLYRIVIEDTVQKKILGLQEFFGAFSVNPPAGFYDKLSNDFTLFIYSQPEGNRFGFITKINSSDGLAALLTSWEPALEAQTNTLFGLMGKNAPALASIFKSGAYKDVSFRFQTFSRQDLGIVYAVYGDYFIFTGSMQSMQKILDKLKETPTAIKSDLEKLTLAEKVGQLFLIGIEGTEITPTTENLIEQVQPGGILLLKKNIESESQTKKLINDLRIVAGKTTGLPLFIAIDQEGGVVAPLLFGSEKTPFFAVDNLAQAYYIGLNKGEELKNLGINLNLAPVLDKAAPGDFIFNRVSQKNDDVTGALAKAIILGQKEASILTAIKHFPGYGDIAVDPEKELQVLQKTPEIKTFLEAAQASPEFIMVSNAIYQDIDPELPFVFSEKGINLLKSEMGDDLLIMTDDLPQRHLLDTYSLKGMVTLPIKAGVDILTFSGWSTTAIQAAQILVEAVENNEITEKRIDQSVSKILELKNNLF